MAPRSEAAARTSFEAELGGHLHASVTTPFGEELGLKHVGDELKPLLLLRIGESQEEQATGSPRVPAGPVLLIIF